MNGLTLVALLAVVVGLVLAWRAGVASGRRAARAMQGAALRPAVVAPARVAHPVHSSDESTHAAGHAPLVEARAQLAEHAPLAAEHARLARSLVAENDRLRGEIAGAQAATTLLADLAEDRRALFGALAAARAETARYRALVIDLENNAPPPLLDGPSAPDDLKLVVGIGPVLERMLQQMGIATYRQIARWSEREIDQFDARLPEFPGRIRRDAWVTQARALYQSKYGEALPQRGR